MDDQAAGRSRYRLEQLERSIFDGKLPAESLLKTLRELQAHQAELELQNKELRRARERLELSEQRYAHRFQLAPVGYCTLSSRGCIQDINQAAANILGQPVVRLEGKPFLSVVRQLDFEEFWRHLSRAFERFEATTSGLTMTRRDGQKRTLELTSTVMEEPGRLEPLCFTTLVDISDRIAAEQRLRSLSELGDELIAVLDQERLVQQVADFCARRLGQVCVVRVGGNPPSVGVAHPDSTRASLLLDELMAPAPPAPLASLQSLQSEHVFRDAPLSHWLWGVRRPGIALVAPLLGRDTRLGWMLIARGGEDAELATDDRLLMAEVVQRVALAVDNVRLYREAFEQVRTREDFVSLVSHDLVNANVSVKLSTDLLIGTLQRSGQNGALEQARRIRSSTQWMLSLTRRFLDIARLESGALVLDVSPELLSEVVDEAIELAAPLASEQGVAISLDVPRGMKVRVERDRVSQILFNLLTNAVKFSARGQTVEVRAALRAESVCVTVTDRGMGIPESDLPHLFDRFWQARRAERAGVGLGLAIARALVEAHRGAIWVESKLGQGSTFYFTLPPVRAAGSPREDQHES